MTYIAQKFLGHRAAYPEYEMEFMMYVWLYVAMKLLAITSECKKGELHANVAQGDSITYFDITDALSELSLRMPKTGRS